MEKNRVFFFVLLVGAIIMGLVAMAGLEVKLLLRPGHDVAVGDPVERFEVRIGEVKRVELNRGANRAAFPKYAIIRLKLKHARSIQSDMTFVLKRRMLLGDRKIIVLGGGLNGDVVAWGEEVVLYTLLDRTKKELLGQFEFFWDESEEVREQLQVQLRKGKIYLQELLAEPSRRSLPDVIDRPEPIRLRRSAGGGDELGEEATGR